MTYISSAALTNASRQAVTQAQSKLADLQKELSSGAYADVGLPVGASAAPRPARPAARAPRPARTPAPARPRRP